MGKENMADETDVWDEQVVPELRPHYVRYKAMKQQMEWQQEKEELDREKRFEIHPAEDEVDHEAAQEWNEKCRESFLEQYRMELDRVQRFISTTLESIGMNVEAVQEALALPCGTSPSEDGSRGTMQEPRGAVLRTIRQKCNDLCQETVNIEAFSLQNAAAFARLAQQHDRRLDRADEDGERNGRTTARPIDRAHSGDFAEPPSARPSNAPLMPLFLDWFEKEFVQSVVFDRIVVMLSDIFAELREAEEEQQREDSTDGSQDWVPPDSFERKTTKYWVHPKHVLRVKLLVIKHLPVLIFGSNRARRTASCTDSRLSFFYKDKLHDSQDISSIYFDNQGLEVYKRRLVREDLASLHRVRWYGDRKPKDGNKELFVERKVHRNSWTGHRSCKERVSVAQRNVPDFLSGKIVPEMEENSECNRGFLKQVQEVLIQEKQRPMIRTCYKRTAFQLSTSNAVRISLDTDLRMVNEKGTCVTEGDWCRDLSRPIYESESVLFPYAILEIKLQTEERPEWIEDLLATGMLVEAPKFSKFQHAIAMLHSKDVEQLPYWVHGFTGRNGTRQCSQLTIDEMAYSVDASGYEHHQIEMNVNADIHKSAGQTKALLSERKAFYVGQHACVSPLEQNLWVACQRTTDWFPLADLQKPSRIEGYNGPDSFDPDRRNCPDISGSQQGAEANAGEWMEPMHEKIDNPLFDLIASKPGESETPEARLAPGLPVDAVMVNVKDDPKDAKQVSGRRFFLHSLTSTRTPRGEGDGHPGSKNGSQKLPSIVRTRVEPKTFFANERTFLSWLSISVLVMFTSLSLLNGSSLDSAGGTSSPRPSTGSSTTPSATGQNSEEMIESGTGLSGGQISGIVIAPMAILFMIYALYMYRLRTKQILLRQTVRYDDQRGPVGLVVLLIGVTITSYIVSILYFT
uniref:SPX domain-containing protein n=1 Tax=Picocystis salinarum TaxID=88271 RepID=A0A7S3UB82_9CHLO